MSELPTAQTQAGSVSHAAELAHLHEEIQRRGAAIQGFELALEQERHARAKVQADIEEFVRRLARAEDECEALRSEMEWLRHCQPKGLAARLHARRRLPARPGARPLPHADVPGIDFVYYLNTSPYRLYRDPAYTLKGWCFPRTGEPITALRARVDDREFFGTYGLDEPSVIAAFGPQPNNPRPGFKLVIETPPGRHHLSLEARVADGPWSSFLKTPIWAHPTS